MKFHKITQALDCLSDFSMLLQVYIENDYQL